MQDREPGDVTREMRAMGAGMRLRRLRVYWLPMLLVALDVVLLTVAVLLALVLLPVFLLVLILVAMLRSTLSWVTRGRFPRTREETQAAASPRGNTLPPEVREDLARRFRPVIIAFPEIAEEGPPYRTDELAAIMGADYHPRAVEMFLDHARLRKGRTQWLPEMPDMTAPREIREFIGDPHEAESSLEMPWLHGGNPLRIVRHLFPFGRQFRAHWAIPVPQRDCGCSTVAWNRYMRMVEADNQRHPNIRRYPHTVYARVVEGRELPDIGEASPLAQAVAVQYWWFMFYNDAWNRHQGDWEGITVFFRSEGDEFQPIGAAYGSHDLGRWRRWQDVQRWDDAGVVREDGTHPVVYMARGSHASYFDYNPTGYHPSMSRAFRVPFIGDFRIPSQFVLESRNAVDWVADPRSGLGNAAVIATDNVRVMPPEQELADKDALKANDDWWWLAYDGLWGSPEPLPFFGGSGPRGPRGQGLKWDNPFSWVLRECIADDMPYWVETFAHWEEPATTKEAVGTENKGA